MKKIAAMVSMTVIALVVLPASESDVKIREVRFGAIGVPASDGVDLHDTVYTVGSGTATGKGFDENVGWSVGAYESFGSLKRTGVPYIGISLSQVERTGSGSDLRRVTYPDTSTWDFFGPVKGRSTSFDIHLGYALPISAGLHTEWGAFWGYGTFSVSDVTTVSGTVQKVKSTGSGNWMEYGVEGTGVFTWDNGCQLGGTFGYMIYTGKNVISYLDARSIYEVSGSGPFATVFVGFHF